MTATRTARTIRISARSRASCRAAAQPSCRSDNQLPREQQPISRPNSVTQQPREHTRTRASPRSRNISRSPQPQPVIADAGGVDRLPSFITGPQPQVNGAPGFEGNGGGGERFPRRRRRPHGPRPDGVAAPAAPSEDFNPGNESALADAAMRACAVLSEPAVVRRRGCSLPAYEVVLPPSTTAPAPAASTGISRVRSRCAGIAR